MIQFLKTLARQMAQLPSKDQFFIQIPSDNEVFHVEQPVIPIEDKTRPTAGDTQQGEKHETNQEFYLGRPPQTYTYEEPSFSNNFLAQHIKALGVILKNFIESRLPGERRPKQNWQLYDRQTPLVLPLKNKASSSLSSFELRDLEMGIAEFIEDLKKQPDLNAFLGYIVDNLQKRLAISLVVLTVNIWTEVKDIDFRDFEVDDLRVKAETWTNEKALNYFQRPDFQPLRTLVSQACHQTASDSYFSKFSSKVRHYITTVLLILAGYFQNPYASDFPFTQCQRHVDYPKRQFSSVSINFLSRQILSSNSDDIGQPFKKVKTE